MNLFFGLFNYLVTLFLVMFGIYVMIARKNLIRKIIGMAVLQTGVILFYITASYKAGGGIPIIDGHDAHAVVDVTLYANPLPHALMLTAIVVGVSTLGLALVLVVSIYRSTRTIEEDEMLQGVKRNP